MAGADPVFVAEAVKPGYDDFVAVLKRWESLADADGAAEAAERTHSRRDFSLLEDVIDGSFHI